MNHSSYTKEQFVEYIKSLVEEDSHEVFEEKFYEKELDIWNELDSTEEIDLEIETTGYIWNVDIEQRGEMICAGFYNHSSELYNIKYVVFFRHCADYSRVVARPYDLKRVGKSQEGYYLERYFNRNEDERKLVENGKIVFGVYFRIFNTEQEEQYLNSLKNLINDNNQKIITDEYYEYKMENWDKIKHDKIVKYIYPNFNKLKLKFNNHNGNIYFSLEDCSLFENRSSYDANIILTLHNINDITCCYAKSITTTVTHFDEDNYIIKFPNFIKEVDLYTKNKSNKSIIENNKCIIGLYTRYYESDKNKIRKVREPLDLSLSSSTSSSSEDIDIVIPNDDEMEPLLQPKENKTTTPEKSNPPIRYAVLALIVILYYCYYFYYTYIFCKVMKEINDMDHDNK
ncbi:hypothetical protein LY90DRAFT_669834 [Neocallimastix californiae]|jgi:hypothetical protein|uniref:MATH domain-containing protein n=1 Tax=Neocallimastix californiae TaxID=1754190 RepID=A0A1Y2D643_9FUNG|nr:hypothetical protein LY90DRAFT_669834 [Neocallimastix californiae]|eukprot:ORY54763.1 hypothetical protein LY90DRAFT_669834 [Neocallimastix californiae]